MIGCWRGWMLYIIAYNKWLYGMKTVSEAFRNKVRFTLIRFMRIIIGWNYLLS